MPGPGDAPLCADEMAGAARLLLALFRALFGVRVHGPPRGRRAGGCSRLCSAAKPDTPCPISTGWGTRRVHLVRSTRGGGGLQPALQRQVVNGSNSPRFRRVTRPPPPLPTRHTPPPPPLPAQVSLLRCDAETQLREVHAGLRGGRVPAAAEEEAARSGESEGASDVEVRFPPPLPHPPHLHPSVVGHGALRLGGGSARAQARAPALSAMRAHRRRLARGSGARRRGAAARARARARAEAGSTWGTSSCLRAPGESRGRSRRSGPGGRRAAARLSWARARAPPRRRRCWCSSPRAVALRRARLGRLWRRPVLKRAWTPPGCIPRCSKNSFSEYTSPRAPPPQPSRHAPRDRPARFPEKRSLERNDPQNDPRPRDWRETTLRTTLVLTTLVLEISPSVPWR